MHKNMFVAIDFGENNPQLLCKSFKEKYFEENKYKTILQEL
jgi:hypothetical protein